jgi:DNA-directed RNA polymerase specialized sigma24 family protein
MGDSRVINALRKQSPDSVAKLFDAYGEQLFQYCWLTLRSGDAAVAAARDTVIAARAHIGRLRDPELLAPWLYALARVQCQHRTALPPGAAVVPPARTGQPDAGARLIAWHAVMSLSAAEREALDLVARHGMSARDAGLVTGLGAVETDYLIGQAQASLQRALTAELAFDGTASDHPVPDRLAPRRVVSVAKVYARLPSLTLPPAIRGEVLAFAHDPERENERALAASRVAAFDHAGFPAPPELAVASPLDPLLAAGIPDGSTEHRRRGRSRRRAVGLLAAGAVAAAAFALWVTGLSLPGGTTSAYPAAAPSAISPSGEAPSSVSAGPTLTPPHSQRPGRRTARVSRALPVPGQGVNAEMLYLATSRPPSLDRGLGPVSRPGNDSAPGGPGPSSSQPDPAGPSIPPSQSTSPPAQPTTPAPTTPASTPPTVPTPTQSPTPTSDPSSSPAPTSSPTTAASPSATESVSPPASPSATPSGTSGSPST